MSKIVKPNITQKQRLKRLAAGFVFIILVFYFWLVLEVNSLSSLYRLVLIIPIYLAALSFLESFFSYCVLKKKTSKVSMKIHLISLLVAAIIAVIAVFV